MSKKQVLLFFLAMTAISAAIITLLTVDSALTCTPSIDLHEISVYLEAYDEAASYSAKGQAREFLVLNLTKPEKARQCYELALRSYSQALTIQPNEPGGHMARGAAFMDLEQYDSALADFESVLEIDVHNQHARLAIARTYERSEQLDKAIIKYEEAFEFMENSSYWTQLHPKEIEKYRAKLDKLRRSREK
jgi:tetratricopeptide (TPR) repeat protein